MDQTRKATKFAVEIFRTLRKQFDAVSPPRISFISKIHKLYVYQSKIGKTKNSTNTRLKFTSTQSHVFDVVSDEAIFMGSSSPGLSAKSQ